MKKIKISFAIIFILIFTVLYLIFAAKPLGKEYHYEPEWEINISNPSVTSKEGQFYFKLNHKAGFFDEDGNITQFISYPADDKSSISEFYYTTYSTNAVNTPFYDKNGNEAGIIEAAGFPHFAGDQIFIFLPGGASFSKCHSDGKISWTYDGIIPITAFTSKKDFCAAGLADGTIKVFNNQTGEMTVEYLPGGSDYAVILGLDISNDGNLIASVSGQNKQRFVLAKKENTQVKILYHEYLKEDVTGQTVVKFTKDEKSVLFNHKNGITFVDVANGDTSKIKIDSKIIDVEESENLIFLLGKKNDLYTVYIIETTKSLGGYFSFKAESAFISSNGDRLFVGRDNSLSKIKISKK